METLSYRTEGRLGYLTLQRPNKYNAINLQMTQDLHQFWNERRYDESVGVIILEGGQAKGFCGGLDLEEYNALLPEATPTKLYDLQARNARMMLAMRQAPQVILCCVHGAAAGLGFSLAMASDLRLLASDARFCAAYINIGLGGADMASSYFLPRLIGAGRAYEYLLTGDWMSATEAMQLGFASRLVEREQLLPVAQELAQKMLGKNPLGLRLTKEALNVNLDIGGLEAALAIEDRNQAMVMYTQLIHNKR